MCDPSGEASLLRSQPLDEFVGYRTEIAQGLVQVPTDHVAFEFAETLIHTHRLALE